MSKGPNTMMAKFDVANAYHIIHFHSDLDDRHLLCMQWREKLFIDTALPFGLRSAPKIFTVLAVTVQWILSQEGVDCMQYLDDFIIFGLPNSQDCHWKLAKALQRCE